MKKIVAVVLGVMMAAGFAMAGDMPDALMKGSMELGGSFWFNTASGDLYNNSNDEGQTTIDFEPEFGYFIMDNLMIGIDLGYYSWSQEDDTKNTLGIGPKVAYYLPFEMGPGHTYVSLAYMMENESSETAASGSTVETKFSYSHITLGLGYDVMLSDHTAVFGKLYYDMASGKMTDPVESDSESGSNMGLLVGLKLFHF